MSELYHLSIHMYYSAISDELDRVAGEMQGHLLSRGIRIQQHRIRESQRRVDPSGSVMRRLGLIHRRQYHVNGPRALWHIDGNHKLIR